MNIKEVKSLHGVAESVVLVSGLFLSKKNKKIHI